MGVAWMLLVNEPSTVKGSQSLKKWRRALIRETPLASRTTIGVLGQCPVKVFNCLWISWGNHFVSCSFQPWFVTLVTLVLTQNNHGPGELFAGGLDRLSQKDPGG